MFPKEAEEIFQSFDGSIQRAVQDEEKTGGKIKIGVNSELSTGSELGKNRHGTHSAIRNQVPPVAPGGFSSPGTDTRRTEIIKKPQNRFQAKTKNNKF